MRQLRVGVVGCGTAGMLTAIRLAEAGHRVSVVEQAAELGAVGAGIWLQELGQQVLDRVGVLDDLRATSAPVSRIDGRTLRGRQVMDLGYRDLPGSVDAIGVHRGTLFELLLQRMRRTSAELITASRVAAVQPGSAGWLIRTADSRPLGPFDLLVGADGARSAVRPELSVTLRHRPYPYGAWWALVDDPDRLAGNDLYQCFDGPARYLGLLPTGAGRASLFWSVRIAPGSPPPRPPAVAAWRDEASRFLPGREVLVDRVEELLVAGYSDVAVRRPYQLAGGTAAVLVGDAAHAMSPVLGTGTSLALADAWSLCHFIAATADLPSALAAHAAHRRGLIRWYSFWTRVAAPAFQADRAWLSAARDLLAGPLGSPPWVKRQLIRQLSGAQTGLVGRWRLPGIG